MPREDSTYPQDWIPYAERDWQRVSMLLEVDDPELAGFCLQQAVEKFLKAYLLVQGWKLRKIHDLDALLDDAVTYDASLETFRRPCQRITNFYMVERYPAFPGIELTREDVQVTQQQEARVELPDVGISYFSKRLKVGPPGRCFLTACRPEEGWPPLQEAAEADADAA